VFNFNIYEQGNLRRSQQQKIALLQP